MVKTMSRPRIRLTVLAAARSAQPGEAVAAQDGGKAVCVVKLEDGQLFIVPDRCPHDGGLLSDGFIEDGRLVCSRHGWEFDPKTGACPQRDVCIESRRIVRRRRNPELPLGAGGAGASEH